MTNNNDNNNNNSENEDKRSESVEQVEANQSENVSGGGGSSCNMRVLGVIGGIGSGKSSACELLVSKLGCNEHIDADKLGHSVYAPGSDALNEIVNEFGASLVEKESGKLNRPALGKVVFADPNAMKKLEEIVWPHIRILLVHRLNELKQQFLDQKEDKKDTIVVVEAAIMLDAGWDDICDGVWAVRVSKDTAKERLIKNRGMEEQTALTKIDAQQSCRGIGNIDVELQTRTIHAIIDNDGTQEQLVHKLQRALQNPSSWKNQNQ